jgi:hypothetical protein
MFLAGLTPWGRIGHLLLRRARSSGVEHLTFNQRVDGSIPSGLTINSLGFQDVKLVSPDNFRIFSQLTLGSFHNYRIFSQLEFPEKTPHFSATFGF